MAKSKWAQNRAKRLAKMKWPTSQAGWLARWRKNIKKLRENADDLWADRKTYKEYRKVVMSNPELVKGARFLHLVDHAYLSHILLAVRRFSDNDLRTRSLYNLVEEVRDNAFQLGKAWFARRFRRNKTEGVRQFREHWGGKLHIDKRRVDADLRSLVKLCRRVELAANKNIAHNDRRTRMKPPTYGELDAAIDGIFKLVSRYRALIVNSSLGTPSIQSSYHIFKFPWVI